MIEKECMWCSARATILYPVPGSQSPEREMCRACYLQARADNEDPLEAEPIRKQLRRKKSAPRPGSLCECGCDASVFATYGNDETHNYCQPCYVDAVNEKVARSPLEPSQAEIDDAIASIQTAVQNGAST